MEQINSLPRIQFEDMYIHVEYPDFMDKIFSNNEVTSTGCIDFLERFGLRYISSEEFRKLSENVSFLFINGKYIGAFNLENIIDYNDQDKFILFDTNSNYHQYTQHVVNQRRGLFEIDLYFNNCNDYEMFVIDTGANISSIPYYDYIDLSTYKWNNYPFDKNFKEIRDESLRKDFLLEFNKFFSKFEISNVRMSNSQTIEVSTIFYKPGFYVKSKGCNLKVTSFLCPKDPRINRKIMNMFDNISERPKNSKLLGLDLLDQMHIKFSNQRMIISEYDTTDIRNYLNFWRDEYMIVVLNPFMYLFYDQENYPDLYSNTIDINFSLNEKLELDDLRINEIKIKRNLRLIVIYELNPRLMNFIQYTDNIDGYIIKNTYSLDIHLKDTNCFNLEREYSREKEYEIPTYNDEYDILFKSIVSLWYIDHNFNYKRH